MIKKYFPAYKCPLCGLVLRADVVELDSRRLPEALASVETASMFRSNPYLIGATVPMHVPHQCCNGSAGYAPFAGFIPVGVL